jgi:hypothetical protein
LGSQGCTQLSNINWFIMKAWWWPYRVETCSQSNSIFFLWRCDPMRIMASSFFMFLDHTQRRTTVGRTPLDEWSARRRDLYLTTHTIHNRQTSLPPVGFEPTISVGERPQTYSLIVLVNKLSCVWRIISYFNIHVVFLKIILSGNFRNIVYVAHGIGLAHTIICLLAWWWWWMMIDDDDGDRYSSKKWRVWGLRFLLQWLSEFWSYGMWCRVVW